MKEVYFTRETLASVAQNMLAEVFPEGQKRAHPFSPGRSALLVLDMQEYFLSPDSHAFVPSAPVILSRINSLIHTFREHGRPVFFTQHVNTEENAGSMDRWWRDMITQDHPQKELSPDLDLAEAQVLTKTQYDAFHNTDLKDRLDSESVRQVVVSGVMTHLCCETTARSAFMHGYDVFFLVDGTASYHRDYHLSTLRNLGHGFATLMTCAEVNRWFSRGQT